MKTKDGLSVADALDAAADYLTVFGWQRGSRGVDGGPRCARGALNSVCGDDESADFRGHYPALPEPPLYFREWLNKTGCQYAIWAWNDHSGQTAETVIDTLRIAAADWRLEHKEG